MFFFETTIQGKSQLQLVMAKSLFEAWQKVIGMLQSPNDKATTLQGERE